MSKSLEALENLVHCKSETKCKECKHKYRCTMERDYNTIKQALERLEQLEKAIQILKSNLYIVFNDSYNGVSFKKDKYDECDYTILCLKDKQQYELLKEMLGDDE